MSEGSGTILVGPSLGPEAVVRAGRAARRPLSVWARWLFPSTADVVFAAVLGLVIAMGPLRLLNTDGDLARHLVAGRQILADRSVPMEDVFSYTKAGLPFVPYEWLSEVIFAAVEQGLGLAGVAAVSSVLIALPFLLLTRWSVRDGINPFIVLVLVGVGMLASSIHWLARPHLFSILLALLWTRCLVNYRRSGKTRWLVTCPPMMALWVNLHGGFVLGFILTGIGFIASLGNRRESLAIAATGLVSLVAVGLNPSGYSVLSFVLGYLGSGSLVNSISEFASPDFHSAGPQLFLALVLIAMLSMARLPRKLDLWAILMLVVWSYLGFHSVRNIPLFVVTCLPIVARLADDALRSLIQSGNRRSEEAGESGPESGLSEKVAAIDRALGKPVLPLLFSLVAAVSFLGNAQATQFSSSVFPVAALAHAEEMGAHGNLFNYYNWGGYILYAGYPKYRVFIDGQDQDTRPDGIARQYLKVYRLEPDWETVLRKFDVTWVLIPHDSPLSLMLRRTDGWQLRYQDSTADLFVLEPSAMGDNTHARDTRDRAREQT